MADTLCDNPAQAPTGDDLERMKKAEDVIAEVSVFSTVRIRSDALSTLVFISTSHSFLTV